MAAQDYDYVVEQRDEVRGRMSEGLERLDSVNTKQANVFDELMCKYDELSGEYDGEQERLAAVVRTMTG